MSSGSCESFDELPAAARSILEEARRAAFSTVDQQGRPHVVPICFALRNGELISAIDHKPKKGVVMARIRHLEANPNVAVTMDRWDEDWTRIGWVMVRGTAKLEDPVGAEILNARYPQYDDMPAHDALIVVRPQRILWWTFN